MHKSLGSAWHQKLWESYMHLPISHLGLLLLVEYTQLSWRLILPVGSLHTALQRYDLLTGATFSKVVLMPQLDTTHIVPKWKTVYPFLVCQQLLSPLQRHGAANGLRQFRCLLV